MVLLCEKPQSLRSKTRWFQLFFIFYPTWGRWSNLTSIFVTYGLIETTPRKTLLPRRGGVCVRQERKQRNSQIARASSASNPHQLRRWKNQWIFSHGLFKGKCLVPLGWYPCCLTPPRSPLKGDIPNTYPLHKVYMGLIIKGTHPKGTTIFPMNCRDRWF